LTSIQQGNTSIKETNAAILAMIRTHGLPANPAPSQQPLGAPTQGANPQGPSAPVYFTFGAPAQVPLPQGAPAPLQHQFGAPNVGFQLPSQPAPESYPQGPSAPNS
jgi:hypothetical protein